jgi:divalent metal cation (Fe/Co/Zn/Cd) transporter
MFGLFAVGIVTTVASITNLFAHHEAETSAATVTLAAVSFAVLSVLAWRKVVVAERISSRALRSDGQLTAVGAALGGVTVAGTAATSAFGWWWADPAAALVVAAGACGLGFTVRSVRAELA